MTREKLPGTRVGLCKRIWLRYPDPATAGEGGTQKLLELKIYVHTGEYPDGRLGEVFIKADKAGSLISGLLDTVSISISMGLQHGVPFDDLITKIAGLTFETEGTTSDEYMPRVRSITDAVARWLKRRYPDGKRAGATSQNQLDEEDEKPGDDDRTPEDGKSGDKTPVVLPAFRVK
jgi:hypothetical protein